MCIYGKGGTGKTTLLGTLPGKGLIIDVPQIEGGTFVLEDHSDHIDVIPVETWDAIDKVYWFLAKSPHEYKWAAIDSITAMQELAKRKVITERALDADPHTISLQEWGKIGRLVSELTYKFRTLKMHTIFIAQERRDSRDGEPTHYGPEVTPSALTTLLPSMTLVGRLSVERASTGGWERRLRIGASENYTAKARAKSGLDVPTIVRNPNLGGLLRFLVRGGDRPEEYREDDILGFLS